MTEPKFTVKIDRINFSITPMNKEAEELQREHNSKFIGESLLKFILLSPNTMDINKDGTLTYELDPSFKDEIFKQLDEYTSCLSE